KLLAVDTQTFSDMRERDALYIDKTDYIYKMVTGGKVYFLSRPRRFGKSLMISTLQSLFEGRKDLFEGLYIYDKWDWSKRYPVIRLDWSGVVLSTPEAMNKDLPLYFQAIADDYNIELESDTGQGCFRELIIGLHKKTGQQVAVLIDEYDQPVTSHLHNEYLEPMRKAVHDIYQVMKNCDKYIRFIFITGVSKFSGLSVFSALNNPQDITLEPEYAGICGYTQQELETALSEYIDYAAEVRGETREQVIDGIRKWYDGYSWDGKTRVYNPFSTLKFLKSPQMYISYWFASGTPSYMLDIIRQREELSLVYGPTEASPDELFNGYSPTAPEDIPLLFQTGYLTITNINEYGQYQLATPNGEVLHAMERYLLKELCTASSESTNLWREKLRRYVYEDNAAGLAYVLMSLFSVPYRIKDGKESAYHIAFQIAFKALGLKILSEVITDYGIADAVWELPETVVIIEMKYSANGIPSKMLAAALKQIHKKRYYTPYADRPCKLLAVAFTDATVKCKIETLKN
ncbi:MAG: ATP-binding protein, partial [Tannerella sp.]|nr:ATP-binding protein [Tannerella sp.]